MTFSSHKTRRLFYQRCRKPLPLVSVAVLALVCFNNPASASTRYARCDALFQKHDMKEATAFAAKTFRLPRTRWSKRSERVASLSLNEDRAAGNPPKHDVDNESGALHEEAWYLGDGGFADRHLRDEERSAAKKGEQDFFRERSLSVYDQMRQASMLLLAQQKIIAAQEAQHQETEPRFVAAAGAPARRTHDHQGRKDTQKLPLAPDGNRDDLIQERSGSGSDRVATPAALPTDPSVLSGAALGIGGLDDELEEIRRRVCVPLAAPAELLEDLGITPVRGLLLYGPPGCGKTLLARRLSQALTSRPPAVVSGPEILERFVGSSEANIRALFDYPPDVPGGTDAEQSNALHVIVLDEFDSIGQRRGGGDDGGDRVRDSVVNQLLARMDGFQELDRPTLLVALTNRIDLLDTALLRPGRFEVQVQIPGPDITGRETILKIHTQRMRTSNRIECSASDADSHVSGADSEAVTAAYDRLMSSLAALTEGFTGAELAGLVRAAASYALERAVASEVPTHAERASKVAAKCKVSADDFGRGLADIIRSKPFVAEPTKKSARSAVGTSYLEGDPTAAVKKQMSNVTLEKGNDGGSGKPTVKSTDTAARAVAAGRSEEEIGGSLTSTDLAAVQKLLLQKTSQKEDEDTLLMDAAQLIAQRRKRGENKETKAVAGSGGKENAHGSGREGSVEKKKRKLKKFAHTGWFHTYE